MNFPLRTAPCTERRKLRPSPVPQNCLRHNRPRPVPRTKKQHVVALCHPLPSLCLILRLCSGLCSYQCLSAVPKGFRPRGFTAFANALIHFQSASAASLSTSSPFSARNSRASSTL